MLLCFGGLREYQQTVAAKVISYSSNKIELSRRRSNDSSGQKDIGSADRS